MYAFLQNLYTPTGEAYGTIMYYRTKTAGNGTGICVPHPVSKYYESSFDTGNSHVGAGSFVGSFRQPDACSGSVNPAGSERPAGDPAVARDVRFQNQYGTIIGISLFARYPGKSHYRTGLSVLSGIMAAEAAGLSDRTGGMCPHKTCQPLFCQRQPDA